VKNRLTKNDQSRHGNSYGRAYL